MSLIFVLCLMCLQPFGLTEISQSKSTNDELKNAISLLLELNTAFCGEDVLCKNDSSYWEPPGELVIPKPCCIPCSCSQTCMNRSDCCPAVWRNDSYDDAQHGAMGTLNELITNQTDTNNDTTSLAENTAGGTFEDSDTNSMPSMTSCIRPQVFYSPNHVLDSEAYEMVSTCPEGFKDAATIEKCHVGLGKAGPYDMEMYDKNLADMIPVTSILTGLAYANKYCLDCNGISANATLKFRDWQPTFVGFGAEIAYRDFLRPELILEQTAPGRQGYENIHFIPEKATAPAKCNTYDIQFCNQTGLLDVKNAEMMNSCQNGPALPIIQTVRGKRLLFKNIACLHCNMDKNFTGYLNKCGYFEGSLGSYMYAYSIGFNLQSPANNEKTGPSLRVPYLGESSLRLLKQGQCPPGYTALRGTCREVICPRHHYLRQNKCVPLFDTLSGLDIHVKLQITPDRVITNDVAAEFEGKLKDMVNNVLKKTVSLQVRDIFVMYLQNKERNGKMYYLFDMYLYDSTGKIRFSQAIAEIKGFFSGMTSQALQKLSNGMNIVLKIGFAHKIKLSKRLILDLSNGKSLTVMTKTAWEQRKSRPKFEITNVHWCYRTGFSFTEVNVFGRRVYEMPSNPPGIVYETEMEEDPINRMIYICIDLVVAPTAREGMIPALRTEVNVDINDKGANAAFDRGAALVVSCLVIVLLGFISCKVRARVYVAKTNTDIPSNQTMIEMNMLNDQSGRRKDEQSEQRKDVHTEQRKDGQSEQRKYDQSKRKIDDQTDQRNKDISSQRKDGKSEQRNDDQSEQRKDALPEQRNDGQPEQRKDGQSEQRKNDQSEQRNDDQFEQRKDGQSEQRKDGQSEQRNDGQSEQRKYGQSEQGNDGKSEQI